MGDSKCCVVLSLIQVVHWPVNHPAWGGGCTGKTGPLKPLLTKKMPHWMRLQHSFQWCNSTKNINTVSHPSPPSVDNELKPENEKFHHFLQSKYWIPMPFLYLNPSFQKYPPLTTSPFFHWIVSGMMTRLKNIKMKPVRNEWDVCGAIILSVFGMPLGWYAMYWKIKGWTRYMY